MEGVLLERFLNSTWQDLGKHRVRVQGDVVFLRTLGELELEEVRTLHELCLAVYLKRELIFCVVDATGGGHMGPAVRRWVADYNRTNPCRGGNAVYGANVLVRAVAQLMFGAINLLSNRGIPTTFVRDEYEALVWVDKLRAELAAAPRRSSA